MPPWELTELPTGERVITQSLPHVRSAALGYWIGAGSRHEHSDQAGISHFIEHLFMKGSSHYTAREIAEIFDGLGGEINAGTSRENTVVYARVPDDGVEQSMTVMHDMVTAPRFDEVDSEREVVLEEIAMYEDTPQELVHDLFAQAVFGDQPLGRPVIGEAQVISSVSTDDLAAYHEARYRPVNMVFAASGNIEHEQIVELVLKGGDEAAPPAEAAAFAETPPTRRFQQKDTEQYHVCLGATGIRRADPRRFAAAVLDSILGNSASSRLFQEIREKRGLAYSVYSFVGEYADTGEIGIYVGTRGENLTEAVTIAVGQVSEISSGRFADDEIARAKRSLKGRVALSFESTTTHMNRLGSSLLAGTDILTLDEILAAIEAVEPDQVAALAESLLAPERLSAAGIGPDEARFLDAVEAAAPGALAA